MSAGGALPDLCLDTSVLIDAMFPGLANHRGASQFCGRLVADGSRVYFSQLARLEVAEAIRRLATREQLPAALRSRFSLDAWGIDAAIRARWMAFGLRQFDRLIATFTDVVELPLTEAIWRGSIHYIAQYGMRSHDAAHTATAVDAGLPVFATNDDHFRRVREIDILIVREAH